MNSDFVVITRSVITTIPVKAKLHYAMNCAKSFGSHDRCETWLEPLTPSLSTSLSSSLRNVLATIIIRLDAPNDGETRLWEGMGVDVVEGKYIAE